MASVTSIARAVLRGVLAGDEDVARSRLRTLIDLPSGILGTIVNDNIFGDVFSLFISEFNTTGIPSCVNVRDFIAVFGDMLPPDECRWLADAPDLTDHDFAELVNLLKVNVVLDSIYAAGNNLVALVAGLVDDFGSLSDSEKMEKLESDLISILRSAERTVVSVLGCDSSFKSVSEIANDIVVRILRQDIGGDGAYVIPTGIHTLDETLGGFYPGDLNCIVGEAGVGKSFLAIKFSVNAFVNGFNVLFITTEMNAEHVVSRIISIETGVNSLDIRNRTIGMIGENSQLRMIQSVAESYANRSNRFMIGEGNISVSLDSILAAVEKYQPDFLVVDGVYMVEPSGLPPNTQKWERVAETVKKLKMLALERNISVLCTTQYSRRGSKLGLDGMGYTMEIPRISSIVMSLEHVSGGNDSGSLHGMLSRVLKIKKSRDGMSDVSIDLVYEPSVGLIYEPGNRPADVEFIDEDF